MILDSGRPMFLQALEVEPIALAIMDMPWKRLFLHARAATQGQADLHNCHGWNSSGTYVFHNGILSNPQSDDFEVDSELIRWWLERYGVGKTLNLLFTEHYANVFLVDTIANEYIISRSSTGSLYTDGNGNFSTNRVGSIIQPVRQYSNDVFELGIVKKVDKFYGSYPSWGTTEVSRFDYSTSRWVEEQEDLDAALDSALDEKISVAEVIAVANGSRKK